MTSSILPDERRGCSFNIDKLMEIMGSKKRKEMQENAKRLFFSKPPVFAPRYSRSEDYDSYENTFKQSLARTAHAVQIVRDNPTFMMQHMAGKVNMSDLFETNGVAAIHFTMSLTFLKTNGTKELKERFLDLAQSAHFLLAYAQTELGHGSNLRGLETEAHFDADTDEFIINSPTLTSMKFWPTGMYACTHALVFANLYLRGKACGVHGFMLQLRDEHGNLLPGVEVGEIGPKLKGGHVNIAYARFDNIRIPRGNMVSKHFKVNRDGSYVAPPAKVGKIKNISMMMMRVFNVQWAARDTSKAATIAIRYSCIRKQGFKDTRISDGKLSGEHTILDYKMQQYRLFKTLSLAYKFHFNSRYLSEYLNDVQLKLNMGDLTAADELPELHATISGMKAYSTVSGHLCIEDARKCCGGQGFLRSSGITDLSTSFAEPVTVEGEQVILSLQVSRFLIKSVKQVRAREEPKGSVKYLLDKPLSKYDYTQNDGLVELLKDRARRMAFKLEEKFSRAIADGLSFDEATNSCAVISYKAAKCHSSFVMTRNFLLAIDQFVVDDSNIRDALYRVFQLGALMILNEEFGDWLSLFKENDADEILDLLNRTLSLIRPDAVGLCDGFGHTDDSLRSTLGKFDGNVYESIYEEVKANPLNRTRKMVGWDELKGILDLDFLKNGIGQRHVIKSKL